MKVMIEITPWFFRWIIELDDEVAESGEDSWAMPFDDKAVLKLVVDKVLFYRQFIGGMKEVCRQMCIAVGSAEVMTDERIEESGRDLELPRSSSEEEGPGPLGGY